MMVQRGRAKRGQSKPSADPKKTSELTQRPFAGIEGQFPVSPDCPPPPPPPPPPKSPVPVQASDNDEAFRRAMAGVAPLKDRERTGAPEPTVAPAKPFLDDDELVLAELDALVQGEARFEISDSDEFIEGHVQGLDPRVARKLRGGEYSIQADANIRGLTSDEARLAVAKFIEESWEWRRRCVLVVHGRGLHSKDQIPVLKQKLQAWLARGRMGRLVLAFCTAQPHDGGAGAVYVLLRR